MTLSVVQGPLPQNGQTVDPSSFLSSWISNTYVYGLGAGAFKGGSLTFIYSQTDAPPLQDRMRGTLWYARGEGRLYLWDQNNSPSGVSSAAANVVNWLSLSDRKDIWVNSFDDCPPGTPLHFTASGVSLGGEHNFTHGAANIGEGERTTRVQWAVTKLSKFGNGTIFALNHELPEVIFIARDSALSQASGYMIRACELGFTDFYMSCDATGSAGMLVLGAQASETQWAKRAVDYPLLGPSDNSEALMIGFCTDSSASNPRSLWTRPGFKPSGLPYALRK